MPARSGRQDYAATDDLVRLYLNDLGRHPLLIKEDETRLAPAGPSPGSGQAPSPICGAGRYRSPGQLTLGPLLEGFPTGTWPMYQSGNTGTELRWLTTLVGMPQAEATTNGTETDRSRS